MSRLLRLCATNFALGNSDCIVQLCRLSRAIPCQTATSLVSWRMPFGTRHRNVLDAVHRIIWLEVVPSNHRCSPWDEGFALILPHRNTMQYPTMLLSLWSTAFILRFCMHDCSKHAPRWQHFSHPKTVSYSVSSVGMAGLHRVRHDGRTISRDDESLLSVPSLFHRGAQDRTLPGAVEKKGPHV